MIHKNWQELIKPTQLVVKPGADPARVATVVAEPLERGFGLTLGNALRRVLMSSLQGGAITSVQIDNVLHEFSSVAGVREDVTDIVLNLKGVSLRMEVEGPKRLSISAKGPGVVTAGDISESNGIEILNKDHVICHLDDGADVFMELTVNTGKGYVAADKNKPEDAPIGLIAIDAIFSPVKKVSYEVTPTREGQVLDYDKLTMKVETNGALTPEDAVAYAARILQDQLALFVHFVVDHAEAVVTPPEAAEFAGVESSLQFHVQGIEAHPHRFHEEAPTRRGHGKHVVNLGRVHRERLLDEHMLAGFHHQDRLLAVDGVDAGHIHDVDFGVARKIGHRSVHVSNVS